VQKENEAIQKENEAIKRKRSCCETHSYLTSSTTLLPLDQYQTI